MKRVIPTPPRQRSPTYHMNRPSKIRVGKCVAAFCLGLFSIQIQAAPFVEISAEIESYPLGHFGVNLPWLAFCSGTYLKREGRLIPLPAALLRHCPDRFAYTDVATTFDDELGLPKSIDLLSSQALFLKSHTDWDQELSFGNRYTEWNQ